MLGSTWDGLALRLCGAVAVALGFHALRQLQRPRAAAAVSEEAAASDQPLLAGEQETEAEGKPRKAVEAEAAPAVPLARLPAPQLRDEQEETGGLVGAAPAPTTAAPPTPEQHKKQAGGAASADKDQAAVQEQRWLQHHVAPAEAAWSAAGSALAAESEGEQVLEAAEAAEHAPGLKQHHLHTSVALPLEQQLQPLQQHATAKAAVLPQPPLMHIAVPAEEQPQPPPQQQEQALAADEPQQREQTPEVDAAMASRQLATAAAGEQLAQLEPELAQDASGPLEGEQEAEPGRDPADVAPVPLGSPFVAPALGAPPAVPAIPLFSTFVPPAPPPEAGSAPAHFTGGAGAVPPPSDATSGSSEGGEGPTCHRSARSLLSEGLAEQSPDATEASPAEHATAEEEHRLLAALAGLRQETGPTASVPAAAAAGGPGGAAPPGPPGRAAGLRVELPTEHAEPPLAAAAGLPSPHAYALPQQAGLARQPELLSGEGSSRTDTPVGVELQQQQVAAAAAAVAAEYFAVPAQLAPGRGGSGGGPTTDSVAAALQRAVELAASGSGSLPPRPASGQAPGHGVGFSGFQGAPPGAFPAAWPAAGLHGYQPATGGGGFGSSAGGGPAAGWPVGPGAGGGHPPSTRGALSGGTFRSATVPAPIGQHGPAGGESAWGDSFTGYSMLAERSASIQRERHLPRLSEEVEAVRASMDVDVPLACKLDVVAGPCTNATYTNTEDVLEIIIGRNQGVTMQLNDGEVSGQHAAVRWSSVDKCWKVADLGSLNGTLLNGESISVAGRKRGRDYRLSSDDILQLGSYTKLKVSTFPRDLLDPLQSRCGSLPVGSMPRSLTMPKHRIPSFTSLLSPKITNTPSKKATVAAASDELRLECCIVSRTGRDHQRKGQTCEDVACAECPLHGSEAALGGNPAALFCVFDGHCGRGAADAASTALPDEVAKRLEEVRQPLAAAAGAEDMLHRAFLAADETISAEEGCTATAVLMWRDSQGDVCLQAANVGDSAALFIDPETGRATELTEDHRLTNPRERQRLQDMGIQLASNARRLYGLNLCRGLGDKFLKDEDLGLSAEPYVSGVVRLGEQQGGILLIASDGLWDVTDMDAVTATVCQADKDQDGSVLEITNAVIAHALKQRTKDDVTVLVVRVWPASEWELRSPTKNLDDGEVAAFVSS